MGEQRPFPIVEYAHKIGKNTKDFTANDMVQFTKWWLKQATRKDILAMSSFKQEGARTRRMEGKKGTLIEFQKRYCAPADIEQIDPSEAQELAEKQEQEQEVVCEIGLTQEDVDALVWGLNELITTYDFSEHEEVGTTLGNLLEALKGV